MLRLRSFRVVQPTSVSEALSALAEPGARIVAGGTDLLPNLKHRLAAPTVLVSLDRLQELQQVTADDGRLCIGAGVKLSSVATHALVQSFSTRMNSSPQTIFRHVAMMPQGI